MTLMLTLLAFACLTALWAWHLDIQANERRDKIFAAKKKRLDDAMPTWRKWEGR